MHRDVNVTKFCQREFLGYVGTVNMSDIGAIVVIRTVAKFRCG